MAMPYKQVLPTCLAVLTGSVLLAVFIAPFYGALEPVVSDSSGGQSVIIEDFDYTEPDPAVSAETPDTQSNSPDVLNDQNVPSDLERGLNEPDSRQDETSTEDETQSSLTDIHQATDRVSDDQPMQMLHGAIVVAAGRLEGKGHVISLDDIVVTEVSTVCQGGTPMQWNCGVHARTAFRAWLGSRTLKCRLPENGSSDGAVSVTTDCQLGSESAAKWLVRNGWVKAADGGAYAELGRDAENTKRGIWGSKPASLMPELLPMPEGSVTPAPVAPNNTGERPSGYFPPAPQD
ncbi:thermonuclease family protein [Brucellaceae bacterium C25G]